jgi:hypothetical protein
VPAGDVEAHLAGGSIVASILGKRASGSRTPAAPEIKWQFDKLLILLDLMAGRGCLRGTHACLRGTLKTLARRLTSLAIGTLASRRSTAAFLDAPSGLPVCQGGDKGRGRLRARAAGNLTPAPPNGTLTGRRPSNEPGWM